MSGEPALFASDSGSAGPAVVLLHGFGGWHGTWRRVAARLAQEARVLAYDLPGHAGSPRHPSVQASRAARAILADLDARGVGHVHVAGHSLGGAVAALMAMAAPARVSGLTLLAPGGFGPDIDGPLLRRYAAAAGRDEIGACLAAMSGPDAAAQPALADDLARLRAVPEQSARLVEIAAAITRGDRQGVLPAGELAGLAMPVAVLWGDLDPVLPYAQTRTLPPAFRLQTVRRAGHMLVEEAELEVVSAIGEALRRA